MTQPDPTPPIPASPHAAPKSTTGAEQEAPKPLRGWAIAAVTAGILTLTAATIVVLWWAGTNGLNGQALVTARLDALKTGLAIGAALGAVFALYLAWRRQKSTDIGLQQKERDQTAAALDYALRERVANETKAHQERVAAATESDATERRITDLYTKAADQLGSDKAPVRLAGLYALERLAQSNPRQRQTIVNVLCAYLRMPYTLPVEQLAEDANTETRAVHEQRVQERQVRLTAQRIITDHLRPALDADLPVETFWEDITLDLTGATLINLDLSYCRVSATRFGRALFVGETWFDATMFYGLARFDDATFGDNVSFGRAQFARQAVFDRVTFARQAVFDNATFVGNAEFAYATFGDSVTFTTAKFIGHAGFVKTTFDGDARFEDVTFNNDGVFHSVKFTQSGDFTYATFHRNVIFHNTKFVGLAMFDNVLFDRPEVDLTPEFTGATFDREIPSQLESYIDAASANPEDVDTNDPIHEPNPGYRPPYYLT